MAELVERYIDLPLGLVDAAVIAIAERLGLREVATVDHRHFRIVRPRHVEAFPSLVGWGPSGDHTLCMHPNNQDASELPSQSSKRR